MECLDCAAPLSEAALRQGAQRCRPCARKHWHRQYRANLTDQQREQIRAQSRERDGKRRSTPLRSAKLAAYRKAHKMRKRYAASQPYTLAEIAQRDGYRCGLCRKMVTMTTPYPHPAAPTIDHIVPLSRGGDDTHLNVQLAHWRCNQRKGTGGSQQLRIVA